MSLTGHLLIGAADGRLSLRLLGDQCSGCEGGCAGRCNLPWSWCCLSI